LLPARNGGKPLLLLRVRAVAVDRVHHEPALYRRRRAKPGVTPLELLHDESVGDVVEARAAVALERRAEHAELAELRDERDRKRARPVMLADDGQKLGFDPVTDRVADHPLLFGQQLLHAVLVDAPEL